MKWFLVTAFLATAAHAQSGDILGATPDPDMLQHASETDSCINDQVTKGPGGLVTRAARSCIGRSARACSDDPVICANLEKTYWEWRIGLNYRGLQAWVADRANEEGIEDLRASVANPSAATANVPLECALRVSQRSSAETALLDTAVCEMRETALIALELEFTVREACEDGVTDAFARFCGKLPQ